MQDRRSLVIFALGLTFFLGTLSQAADGSSDKKTSAEVVQGNIGSARSKKIDFEGDFIEGMDKSPLDSLNQISEGNNRRNKQHLYRKRPNFKSEILNELQELRYIQ